MRDHYATLGISGSASTDEVRQRYRFLAQAYHPDKFPDPRHKDEAEKAFKEVQEAYRILSDPGRRAAYDLSKRTGTPPGPSAEDGPRRETSRRPPRYVRLRQKFMGLSGARWLIAVILLADLLTPDPFRLVDEMTLVFLFFSIDTILDFLSRS